jgi:phytoene synthase
MRHPPRDGLAGSLAYCERLTRRAAGNFYPAFRVLPRPQRLAMCALYAFLRVTDDLADEPGPADAKARTLAAWRKRTDEALTAGVFSHRLHAAFHDTVARHAIPREYLDAVLDGVETDLRPVAFTTFAELYRYCYRVASAVGLCCIHIWGFRGEKAKEYAEAAGVAFQLTNILRDLAEDRQRGRVYLPVEDWQRFDSPPERWADRDGSFRDLMRFEVARARGYYDASRPLARLLPPAGRAVFQMMSRTYRGLLDQIERRDYDVFTRRVRLSRWRKLGLLMRAMPARWGLVGMTNDPPMTHQ